MKILLLAMIVTAATLSAPALAADVGVSISIGQPGFYGQIDIGNYPPPLLIYRQPIMVERVPMNHPPIYLRVPPGHAKHWSRYCREYNACGERVLFVQDNWYNRVYVPRYQEQHRDRQDNRRDMRNNDNRGNQNIDHGRRDERGNEGRGNQNNDRQGGNKEHGR